MSMLHRFQSLWTQHGAIVRYALVGSAGTLIDLGTVWALVEWFSVPVLWAATEGFLLAVFFNYILNKTWTFEVKSDNHRKFFIKFLLVSLGGLGLTLSLMWFFVDVQNVHYLLAKGLTSVLVVGWNFFLNKHWTFRLPQRQIRQMDTHAVELSVVLPAYNEAERLPKTLRSIHTYLEASGLRYEVLVVDDGSTDDTIATAEAMGARVLRYPKNEGKGYAIATGVKAARGAYILAMDADGSTPISEIEKLLPCVQQGPYDIALGSRYVAEDSVKVAQSGFRRWIGRTGNRLIRFMLIDGIYDTQCGYKLFRYAAAQDIFSRQKVYRWGFDMEALATAKMLGYTMLEIPVDWYNDEGSRLRPVRDALRTLSELVYIKLNIWSGRYR